MTPHLGSLQIQPRLPLQEQCRFRVRQYEFVGINILGPTVALEELHIIVQQQLTNNHL